MKVYDYPNKDIGNILHELDPFDLLLKKPIGKTVSLLLNKFLDQAIIFPSSYRQSLQTKNDSIK